jgi:hypothetical protein
MAVQFLSPGQTHDDVTRMKRRLVTRLLKLGFDEIAQKITIKSTTYGPVAEEGVRKFQRAKNLQHVDGLVGEDTWRALGVRERVIGGPQTHPDELHNGGQVVVVAGANKPGKSITPMTLTFVAKMAGRIDKPIKITTGTNHSKFTVNGNVSDHFTGHAVDIGMFANGGTDDSPVGDRIMEAACFLAGDSRQGAKSKARTGGLFTFTHGGKRIQCIWKTNEGGNHHNHVHVGVRPA